MNLENIIKHGSNILKSHNIDTHALDAEIILSNIMKVKKEFLITNSEKIIPREIIQKYDIAIKRRAKNEPVA